MTQFMGGSIILHSQWVVHYEPRDTRNEQPVGIAPLLPVLGVYITVVLVYISQE
jgi:hypothetical protein